MLDMGIVQCLRCCAKAQVRPWLHPLLGSTHLENGLQAGLVCLVVLNRIAVWCHMCHIRPVRHFDPAPRCGTTAQLQPLRSFVCFASIGCFGSKCQAEFLTRAEFSVFCSKTCYRLLSPNRAHSKSAYACSVSITDHSTALT